MSLVKFLALISQSRPKPVHALSVRPQMKLDASALAIAMAHPSKPPASIILARRPERRASVSF